MRKYYYVCPRCGRCYKRYIPRRKTKCGFCSTVWKTRGAKGTRSAFSWTATLATIAACVALIFFVGRELGVFPKTLTNREGTQSWDAAFEPLTESDETNETNETNETTGDAERLEALESGENLELTTDSENAENVEPTAE